MCIRDRDWSEWSREAVRLTRERNNQWVAKFGLTDNPYNWCLSRAEIMFRREKDFVVADICVVGTTSIHEGTFLWSWANEGIPENAKSDIHKVRKFGENNDLTLLIKEEWEGGRTEALEMLANSTRILDGEGAWVDTGTDVSIFFVLTNFRAQSQLAAAGSGCNSANNYLNQGQFIPPNY